MQHLACLLLLKNIPRYSLLSFYKLKVTQPCFLLISKSYQEHSQDLHCAECHITSYRAENSQRFTSTSDRQQKCRNFSKIPRYVYTCCGLSLAVQNYITLSLKLS
jgi:hypothetical protein